MAPVWRWALIARWLVVIPLACASHAEQTSPAPSVPSVDKTQSQQKAEHTTDSKAGSASEQQTTVTPPPSVNVPVSGKLDTSSPHTDPESHGQQHNWWDPIFADFKATDWLLALFTGLLWWATWGLRSSTDKLWQVAKTQLTDARIAAEAARDSAKAAVDGNTLNREMFIATHRPRVILRDAYCVNNEIGDPIQVFYTIANIGETKARVVQSSLNVAFVTGAAFGAEVVPTLIADRNDIGPVTLEAGQQLEDQSFVSTRRWDAEDGTRHTFTDTFIGVFFRGHILYEDDRGVSRHTAFYRKYDLKTSRFYALQHEGMKPLDYAD
jgi:hypothetical protein